MSINSAVACRDDVFIQNKTEIPVRPSKPRSNRDHIPHALKSKVMCVCVCLVFLGVFCDFQINFTCTFLCFILRFLSLLNCYKQYAKQCALCVYVCINALHGNEPSVKSFVKIDKQKKQFDRKK